MAIRVLVVDDSILFRTKLQLSLTEDRDIQVIGCAADAMEAMSRIEELKPDVITLDVEMPKLNGIDFLKQLIPKRPIPVVVVSSLPINALDALDAGAVDFVRKPSPGAEGVKIFIEDLKAKIKIAARAKVRRLPPPRPAANLVSRLAAPTFRGDRNTVIAIGASTGGTEAIIEVVKDLPPTTPGIVIVQHMPANFTKLYAQRLNKICKMQAKEAQDFDRVEPGWIILGAGEYHLTLKKTPKAIMSAVKEARRSAAIALLWMCFLILSRYRRIKRHRHSSHRHGSRRRPGTDEDASKRSLYHRSG